MAYQLSNEQIQTHVHRILEQCGELTDDVTPRTIRLSLEQHLSLPVDGLIHLKKMITEAAKEEMKKIEEKKVKQEEQQQTGNEQEDEDERQSLSRVSPAKPLAPVAAASAKKRSRSDEDSDQADQYAADSAASSSSSSYGGEEDDDQPSAKKPKPTIAPGAPARLVNGELNIQLGPNRRCTVSKFKGITLIDIRETYTDGTGTQKPTKKGIALKVEQFEQLMKFKNTIESAVQQLGR